MQEVYIAIVYKVAQFQNDIIICLRNAGYKKQHLIAFYLNSEISNHMTIGLLNI